MEPKVSIVVPVYNVADFLPKCVDSLLRQTYENIEIVLVDDGSTDDSGKLCDEYRSDPRVVVVHKANGGLADARNVGTKASCGEYVTYIDSDDWVGLTYVETFVTAALKADADLVIARLVDVQEGEDTNIPEISERTYAVPACEVNKSTAYRRMLLQDGVDVSSTAKLFSREICNKVSFVSGMLYEDIAVIDQFVEAANKIVILDYGGYYYLQRGGSIMYSNFSPQKLVLIQSASHLVELMQEKYPENVDAAIHRYVYCNMHLLGRSVLDRKFDDISRQLRVNVLSHKRRILHDNLYGAKERIALLLLLPGVGPFKLAWKYYKGH